MQCQPCLVFLRKRGSPLHHGPSRLALLNFRVGAGKVEEVKRGTTEHPKFKSLCQRLNLRIYEAVGLLECLWQFTARYARPGDVGRWTDEDVAAFCGWPMDKAADIMAALADTGWLDRDEGARFLIHDWHDHADDATHMAIARAREWFANGKVPKFSRLYKKEQEKLRTYYAQNTPPVRRLCAQNTHTTRTVCAIPPLPCPALPSPPIKPCAQKAVRTAPVSEAEQIYQAYPRKTARKAALKAITATLKEKDFKFLLEAVQAYTVAVELWPAADREKYVPYPATWFNDGRYDDDRETWKRNGGGNGANRGNNQAQHGYHSGTRGADVRAILEQKRRESEKLERAESEGIEDKIRTGDDTAVSA